MKYRKLDLRSGREVDISAPLDMFDKKRIEISKVVSLIYASSCIVFPALLSYFVGFKYFWPYFVISVYYFWYGLRSGRETWLFSRTSFLILSNTIIVLASFQTGRSPTIHLLLFTVFTFTFLVFSLKDKFRILISTFSSITALLILELSDYHFFAITPFSSEQLQLILYLSLACPLVVILAQVYVANSMGHRSDVELKKLVEQLKKRDEILSETQAVGNIGLWDCDLSTNKISWSDQIYQIYEVPRGSPMSVERYLNFFEKQEDSVEADIQIKQALQMNKPFDMQFAIRTGKGNTKWVRTVGQTRIDSKGIAKIFGTGQDITESHLTETTKQQQKLQLERIASNSPAVFYQFKLHPDGHYSVPFISNRAQDIWEIPVEKFYENGNVGLEFCHPEDVESYVGSVQFSAKNLTSWKWTGRIITNSGKTKWIRGQADPELQADKSILWDGVIIEFTQQKQLEQQLEQERLKAMHASKMAALGQMAGGVAHEINNPLAIIDGYTRKLQKLLKQGPTEADQETIGVTLEKIVATGQRITRIVSGLRNFSRDGSSDPLKVSSIHTIIEDTLALCSEKFRHRGIEIRISPTSHNLKTLCRPTEISQVLLNLLTNAYDAVENQEGEKWVQIDSGLVDGDIEIKVTDNGPGIKTEVIDQIFRPFFTTKETGQGTGLGLSISQGIIKNHNGKFYVNKEHPRTQFVVVLPGQNRASSEAAV